MVLNKRSSTKPQNARKLGKQTAERDAQSFFPGQEAVAAYAELLANPFESVGNIGVPIAPAIPSQKASARAYGTCVTNGTGYSFASCNACPASSAVTGKSNLQTTDQTYAPAYFGHTTATGQTLTAHNGPILEADYTTGEVETRTVAVGLRIRYIGTTDAMQGNIVIVRNPYGQTMAGAVYVLSHVREWQSSESIPVSREWATVVWTPTHTKDTQYLGADVAAIMSDNSIGFMVVGGGPTNSFEVEYVIHYEQIGNSSRGVTINPLVGEHGHGVVSHIANHKPGFLSKLINRLGPGAMRLGKKLASDYWRANRGQMGKRVLSFMGRSAPLALL